MFKHKDSANPDWCTWLEFVEYYADVSTTIQSDDYFCKLLHNTWSLERRGATDLQERPMPEAAYNARPKTHD